MALNAVEQNMISIAAQQAKTLVAMQGTLNELNVLYNGASNYKNSIVQSDLDSLSSLSGLTKQQLDDGMFALTSTLLTDINNALTQLIALAVRS